MNEPLANRKRGEKVKERKRTSIFQGTEEWHMTTNADTWGSDEGKPAWKKVKNCYLLPKRRERVTDIKTGGWL